MSPVLSAREAFLCACWLDVAVAKPGNVSIDSPGHGMQAALFVASAQAAAPHLFASQASVGTRIEAAVAASWAATCCNTNLGIVLLCAPLAAAQAAQSDINAVLDGLTVDDSEATYRAIRLANPGGLGHADREDVHAAPSLPLRQAMALAATRDSIAAQYANGFADVGSAAQAHAPPAGAHQAVGVAASTHVSAWVARIYLHWLATRPDSHIVRKHGAAVAHTVMRAAQAWQPRAQTEAAWHLSQDFLAWDQALKQQAINPGTSADLTVATLWCALTRH
jgi:triphosphoribosyl-dephospho-CoA synthase